MPFLSKLYLRCVLFIFGKKRITPEEAASIWIDILGPAIGPMDKSLSNFLKPLNLSPDTIARLQIERVTAYFYLFAHLFEQSCGDKDFTCKTIQNCGTRIALSLAKDEESYNHISRSLERRGPEYLRILAASEPGDYSEFSRAYCSFLDIPDSVDTHAESFAATVRLLYHPMIARIWETMKIK